MEKTETWSREKRGREERQIRRERGVEEERGGGDGGGGCLLYTSDAADER